MPSNDDDATTFIQSTQSINPFYVQLAINMLFLCAQSVSIGFHLNGVSTAKRSAKEMQTILKEAPMIERDIPGERPGLLVV